MPIETTDTSEGGLETLIERSLTEDGTYEAGHPQDFDAEHALDPEPLFAFLRATQPDELAKLERAHSGRYRRELAQRLHERLRKKGLLHLLRGGVTEARSGARFRLYYPRPSFERSYNPEAWENYEANRLTVTRQVRFQPGSGESVDVVLFVNGLPFATIELKNRLTGQSEEKEGKAQYKSRDSNAPLFRFKRCLVHFAADDERVSMTTKLDGEDTFFLPFNKGREGGGAGNPPNPDGLATSYLWEDVLRRDSLNDLILSYAQTIEEEDQKGVTKEKLIFPRYHQRDAVEQLVGHARSSGAGERYLIQHSAGSGKTFTMTWLAHRLASLTGQKGQDALFDTVVVVTDRVHLDRQIREHLRQTEQTRGVVEAITKGSRQLREALEAGKKIITSTVQKFPHVVEEIGRLGQQRFAIIIDEAHSSQGGSFTAAMNRALGDAAKGDFETVEDALNALVESRKLLGNASYFAFTATPKDKTIELFGHAGGDEGSHALRPFHTYSMQQAIDEDFIFDVLEDYTPYDSFYKVLKTAASDPEVKKSTAHKKLRYYVETHPHAVSEKAKVMVYHFIDSVIGSGRVGGKARAMIVTKNREMAIRYFWAVRKHLEETGSKWKPLVAFSDTKEVDGASYDEATLNGFPSDKIEEKFRADPYRFLIVADKFQTGFDEPLLHTMYVDKKLGGVRAVQTLSRLNRQHPEKSGTFVLDFQNSTDIIKNAFGDYCTTTVLSGETDPNKLANLRDELDDFHIYTREHVEALAKLFIGGADRKELDPILNECKKRFVNDLGADEQADFKAKARSFERTYAFLSQVIQASYPYWEQLFWFVKFLLPKLPALAVEDEDAIREHVDMESYRLEKKAAERLSLDDEEATLDPQSPEVTGRAPGGGETDRLSSIIAEFNERFGSELTEDDRIQRFLFEDLPSEITEDEAFVEKVQNSDPQNAKITLDDKIEDQFQEHFTSHTDLYKAFFDDPDFRGFVQQMIFEQVYGQQKTPRR